MRVLWNGMCDPTLHLIALAFLLMAMGAVLDFKGTSSGEAVPIKRCRFCVRYHYKPGMQCSDPTLHMALRHKTD